MFFVSERSVKLYMDGFHSQVTSNEYNKKNISYWYRIYRDGEINDKGEWKGIEKIYDHDEFLGKDLMYSLNQIERRVDGIDVNVDYFSKYGHWNKLDENDNVISGAILYNSLQVQDWTQIADSTYKDVWIPINIVNSPPIADFTPVSVVGGKEIPDNYYVRNTIKLKDASYDEENEKAVIKYTIKKNSNIIATVNKQLIDIGMPDEITATEDKIKNVQVTVIPEKINPNGSITQTMVDLSFTPLEIGTYEIQQQIYDKDKLTDRIIKSIYINVEPAPPVAVIKANDYTYINTPTMIKDASTDPNDDICIWNWTKPFGSTGELNGSEGGYLSFNSIGTQKIKLEVIDETNLKDNTTKDIKVIEGVPIINIESQFDDLNQIKENRKYIISVENSLSPEGDPIQWDKTEWSIEPLDGQNKNSIKIDEETSNQKVKEMLFKELGRYKIRIKLKNNLTNNNPNHPNIVASIGEVIIKVTPDDPPVGTVYVESQSPNFRDNPIETNALVKAITSSLDYDIVKNYDWEILNDKGEVIFSAKADLLKNVKFTVPFRLNTNGIYKVKLKITEEFGQPTIDKFVTIDDLRYTDIIQMLKINWIPDIKFDLPVGKYENESMIITTVSKDERLATCKVEWSLKRASEKDPSIMETVEVYDYIDGFLNSGGGNIKFKKSGLYSLVSKITDEIGQSYEYEDEIRILPLPTAVISDVAEYRWDNGTNKEFTGKQNRLISLNGNASFTGDYISQNTSVIDRKKDYWEIIPLDGQSMNSIKVDDGKDGELKSISSTYYIIKNNEFDEKIVFKEPGRYQIRYRITDKNGRKSKIAEQIITIYKDLSPKVSMESSEKVYRNETGEAEIKMYNIEAVSIDQDNAIMESMRYRYDSNNDGNYEDEGWSSEIPIEEEIINAIPSNTAKIKAMKVGMYQFEIKVKETYGQPTIDKFITEQDKKSVGIYKVVEVDNAPPVGSLGVKNTNNADIKILVGDLTGTKRADVQNNVNNLKTWLESSQENIKTDIQVIDMAKRTDALKLGNSLTWRKVMVRGLNPASNVFRYIDKAHTNHTKEETSIFGCCVQVLPKGVRATGWNGLQIPTILVNDAITDNEEIDITTLKYNEHKYLNKSVPPNNYVYIMENFFTMRTYNNNHIEVGAIDQNSGIEILTDPSIFTSITDQKFGDFDINFNLLYSKMITQRYKEHHIEQNLLFNVKNETNAYILAKRDTDDEEWIYGKEYPFVLYQLINGKMKTIREFHYLYDLGYYNEKKDEWYGNRYIINRLVQNGNILEVWRDDNTKIADIELDKNKVGGYLGLNIQGRLAKTGSLKLNSLYYMNNSNIYDIISKTKWKENADKYIINVIEDNKIDELRNDVLYNKTIGELQQKGITVINIGISSVNKEKLTDMINKNNGKGTYIELDNIYNNFNTTATYIKNLYTNLPQKEYILLNESIDYTSIYSDVEKDPKFDETYKYDHTADYFENPLGTIQNNDKWLAEPIVKFNKVGKYILNYKVQDNPLAPNTDISNTFNNYRKWSEPYEKEVYVHRKPYARFSIDKSFADNTLIYKNIAEDFIDEEYNIAPDYSKFEEGAYYKPGRTLRYEDEDGTKRGHVRIQGDKDNGQGVVFKIEVPSGAINPSIKVEYQTYNTNMMLNINDDSNTINLNAKEGSKIEEIILKEGITTLEFKVRSNSNNSGGYIENLDLSYYLPNQNVQVPITENSYDLDHNSMWNKGIIEWEWRIVDKDGATTSYNALDKNEGLNWIQNTASNNRKWADATILLRVKDMENAWSDFTRIYIDEEDANTPGYEPDFNKPVADFEIDKNPMQLNKEVQTIFDLSYDPDGLDLSYIWNIYKDGKLISTTFDKDISPKLNEEILKNKIGTYEVELTVVNSNGVTSDTVKKPFDVIVDIALNKPPVAVFEINKDRITVHEIENVKITEASYDPDGTVVEWKWEIYKDGVLVNTLTQKDIQTELKTEIRNRGDGSYTVDLVVKDDQGVWSEKASDNIIRYTGNTPPIADFIISPDLIEIEESFNLIDRSYDPDGVILKWEWKIYKEEEHIKTTDEINPSDSFTKIVKEKGKGQYKVELVVEDNDKATSNTCIKYLNVTEGNINPIADFIVQEEIYNDEDLNIVDLSYDNDRGDAVVEWNWKLYRQGVIATVSTDQNPSDIISQAVQQETIKPTYEENKYKITLQVKDKKGLESNIAQKEVQVYPRNKAPEVEFDFSTIYGEYGYIYDDYDKKGDEKIDFTVTPKDPDNEDNNPATDNTGFKYYWTIDNYQIKNKEYKESLISDRTYNYSTEIPITETIKDSNLSHGLYKMTLDITDMPPVPPYKVGEALTATKTQTKYLYIIPKIEMTSEFEYNGNVNQEVPEGGTIDDVLINPNDTVILRTTTNKYVDNLYWKVGEKKGQFVLKLEEGDGTKHWAADYTVPDEDDLIVDEEDYHYVDIISETNWGSEKGDTMTRDKKETLKLKMMTIKLYDFNVTSVNDPRVREEVKSMLPMYVRNLAIDRHYTVSEKYPKGLASKKAYSFYFEVTSKGLKNDNDYIRITPKYYEIKTNKQGKIEIGDMLEGYLRTGYGVYEKYTSPNENMDKRYPLYFEKEKINLIGSHSTVFLGKNVKKIVGTEQKWKGRFGIPGWAEFVKAGEPFKKDDIYKGDILVVFELEAMKNGEYKSDGTITGGTSRYKYIERGQWQKERQGQLERREGYLDGSVILYDSTKTIDDDYESRPLWRE